jgi:Bacterial Ig-like domain/Calcineurin-like phosphoesterase
MKSMKLRVVWVLVGLGLAMLLSVEFMGSEQSVSAQVATAADPIFVGAGDIASCKSGGDEETADLLETIPGTVYTTGDNAYESGTATEFEECYTPSWGRPTIRDRTYPVVGNHEYKTEGARGYFDYFGARAGDPTKGYYSYNLGEWHVVALNSMCEKVGGCDARSPMVAWLEQDLAANPRTCTLAYFHHPLFSSGSSHGGNSKMKPSWEVLYAANADVVLNGHVHNYERFAPQTPSGVADLGQGIREFVVGTGGKSLNTFDSTVRNSEVRDASSNGVLKLTLHPSSYDWQFVTAPNATIADTGSTSCDPAGTTPPPNDTEPPTVMDTMPSADATAVDPTTNVTATFSEGMDPSSINGQTFKLVMKGSTTKIAAQVSYPDPNSPPYTAKLDPKDSLRSGRTYKAVVTTRVKDDDPPGNSLQQQYRWFFTVG